MYHGCCVGDAGLINRQGKHVEKQRLREQLSCLVEKGWKPVNDRAIKEFYCDGKPLPPFSFMVTFDDGYASNYHVAFPVLKELGIPATIFLATDFVDRNNPLWTDRVEFAITATEKQSLQTRVSEEAFSLSLESEEDRIDAISVVKRRLKQQSEFDCLRDVEFLESSLDVAPEAHQQHELLASLNWEQCREMQDSGWITFGANTQSHPILSRCEEDRSLKEIVNSKQIIEQNLQVDCEVFAYPNGGEQDFHQTTVDHVKRAGFSHAMSTINGLNTETTNQWTLNRFGLNNHHSPDDVLALMQISRTKTAQALAGIRN